MHFLAPGRRISPSTSFFIGDSGEFHKMEKCSGFWWVSWNLMDFTYFSYILLFSLKSHFSRKSALRATFYPASTEDRIFRRPPPSRRKFSSRGEASLPPHSNLTYQDQYDYAFVYSVGSWIVMLLGYVNKILSRHTGRSRETGISRSRVGLAARPQLLFRGLH